MCVCMCVCVLPQKDVKLLGVIWGTIHPSESFPLDFALNTPSRLRLVLLLTEEARSAACDQDKGDSLFIFLATAQHLRPSGHAPTIRRKTCQT